MQFLLKPQSANHGITIRPGEVADQPAINQLVSSERLNSITVNAENFLLAVEGSAIVGAVQMRRHADHARELATLVVDRGHRGRGIAGRLIEALLARVEGPVFMIMGRKFADHYAQWGFGAVARRDAPGSIKFNHGMGQTVGILSLLRGRRPRRLAILACGLGLPGRS